MSGLKNKLVANFYVYYFISNYFEACKSDDHILST